MLKNISKLQGVQKLNNKEQKEIKGGLNSSRCPIYTPRQCRGCGGFPLSNGCCLGTQDVHACLTGGGPA